MTWISAHGRQLEFHNRAGLIRVNGSIIGPSQYPVRGRRLFVDSNNGAASVAGESPSSPLSTLQGAIDRLDTFSQEDNAGAEIICLPNHAETVTGVGGLTFDVPGLTVIGLGSFNQRPRFLMDAGTTVSAVVSAADTRLHNLVFAGGHNTIATCFDVDAVGFKAYDIEFEDNTTDEHFMIAYTFGSTTDNVCDGMSIVRNKWTSVDTGPTSFINLTGDCDRVEILDNFISLDGAAAALLTQAAGDDMQGLDMGWNRLITGKTSGALLVLTNDQSDNSGMIYQNYVKHKDTAGVVPFACTGVGAFLNYFTDKSTKSGILRPIADTDT